MSEEFLRQMAVGLARLEEKVDAIREEQERMRVERAEDRRYIVETAKRVGKLELASARTLGWAAGAAAVVATLVGPVVSFVKELFER